MSNLVNLFAEFFLGLPGAFIIVIVECAMQSGNKEHVSIGIVSLINKRSNMCLQ